MSKAIDEEVVELKFDNSHFEKNVATSMSTLDRLKSALKFDKVGDNFSEITRAASKVDMGHISSGLETVTAKFDALSVVGMSVIGRLTNSVMDFGKNLVNTFAIEPVTTGFQEYELKMGSVQTIMASTGADVNKVNEVLGDLNEYADKTIYSFSDMTSSIGKFTNAGVDLDTAVAAIKGISNEAAVSGANAQEASRAMYNFAQALSAGYVKLIDWKSIENANMATVEFKNQLLETALELKTVEKVGNKYITTTTDAQGKVSDLFDATHNFNDALSHQWMTTDVLTKTLAKYASETTDIGQKAYAAAQDVKTFSMMVDTLKEAAQSGWAETWEIIIGDFEEAKSLWTQVTAVFDKILSKITDVRNDLVTSIFDSRWKDFERNINEAGISTDSFTKKLKKMTGTSDKAFDSLLKQNGNLDTMFAKGVFSSDDILKVIASYDAEVSKMVKDTEDQTAKLKKFQKVVKEVWHGDYKNGEARVKALTKAGYNYAEVQALVNKTVDGHTLTLKDLNDTQLKAIGYTDDQIKAIHELAKASEDATSPVGELIRDMSRPAGRDLLIESFNNLVKGLDGIMGSIRKAFNDVFNKLRPEKKIYGIIESVNKLSKRFAAFGTSLADLTDENNKVYRSALAVFDVFDLLRILIQTSLQLAFTTLSTILGKTVGPIGKINTKAADAIISFHDWVVEGDKVNKFVDSFREKLEKATAKVKAFMTSIKDTKAFKVVSTWLTDVKNKAFEIGGHVIDGLQNGVKNKAEGIIQWFKDFIKRIIDTVKSKKDGFDINSPSKVFEAIGQFIAEGLLNGLKTGFEAVKAFIGKMVETIKGAFTGWTLDSSTNQATVEGDKLSSNLDAIGKKADNAKSKVEDLYNSVTSKIYEIMYMIDWDQVLSIGTTVAMVSSIKDLSGSLRKLTGPFGSLADVFTSISTLIGSKEVKKLINSAKGVLKGFKMVEQAFAGRIMLEGVKSLAIGVAILVGAIALLTWLDQDKVWGAFGIVDAILAEMIVVTSILAWLATKEESHITAAAATIGQILAVFGGIIGVILVAVLAAAILDKLKNPEQVFIGLTIIGGIIATIMSLSRIIPKNATDSIKDLGILLLELCVPMLIAGILVKILDKTDWSSVGKFAAILGMLLAALALVNVIALITTAKRMNAMGNLILKLGAAFILIGITLKIIEGVSAEGFEKGIGVATVMVGLIWILAKVTKDYKSQIGKMSKFIASISLLMLSLAVSVKMIGDMPFLKMMQGLFGVSQLLGMLGGILFVIEAIVKSAASEKEGLKRVAGIIISAAFAVGVLAAIAVILGNIEPEKLFKGVIAAGILGLVVAAIIKFAGQMSEAKGTMIGIAILAGVLGVVTLLFSQLDAGALYKAVGAIAILGLIIALILVALPEKEESTKVGYLIVLTLMLAVIGSIIFALVKFGGNMDGALKAAGAIAILMGVMLAVIVALDYLNVYTDKVKKTAVNLLILAGIMALLGGVLVAMEVLGADNSIANAAALSLMLIVLVGCLVIIEKFGTYQEGTISAIGCIALLAIIMGLLAGVLWLIKDLNPLSSIVHVIALVTLLGSLIGAMVVIVSMSEFIAAVPFPVVLYALAIMGMITGGISGIVVTLAGVSWLLNQFGPGIEEGMDRFTVIFSKFGEAIGSFTGNLIAGSIKPLIQLLMDFINGCVDAFGRIKEIDPNIDQSVKNIAAAILALTAAQFVSGITSIINIGSKFGGFSRNLVTMANGIVDFYNAIKDKDIDTDFINKVANAGKAIGEMVKVMPTTGGLKSLFTGTTDFATVANNLTEFAAGIGDFAKTSEGIDPEAVKIGTDAGKQIAAMIKALPNRGWLSELDGHDDTGLFKRLPEYGEGIAAFVEICEGIKPESITIAKKAGTDMAEMIKALPNTGGLAGTLFGDENLDMLLGNANEADKTPLARFGAAIKAFSTETEGINPKNFSMSVTSVADLAKICKTVKDSKDDIEAFGEMESLPLSKLTTNMVNIARVITSTSETVGDTDISNIANIKDPADDLFSIVRMIDRHTECITNVAGLNQISEFSRNLGDFFSFMTSLSEMSLYISSEKLAEAVTSSDSVMAIADMLANKRVFDRVAENDKLGVVGDKILEYATKLTEVHSVLTQMDLGQFVTFADVSKTLAGMADTVDGVVGIFGNSDLPKFGNNLISYTSKLVEVSSMLGEKGVNIKALTDATSIYIQLADMAIALSGKDLSAVDKLGAMLTKVSQKDINKFVDVMTAGGTQAFTSGRKFISEFASGINDAGQDVTLAIESLKGDSLGKVDVWKSQMKERAGTMISDMATEMRNNHGKVYDDLNGMLKQIVDNIFVKKYNVAFNAAGKDVVNSFVDGVNENKQSAIDAVKSMLKDASKEAGVSEKEMDKIYSKLWSSSVATNAVKDVTNGLKTVASNAIPEGTKTITATLKDQAAPITKTFTEIAAPAGTGFVDTLTDTAKNSLPKVEDAGNLLGDTLGIGTAENLENMPDIGATGVDLLNAGVDSKLPETYAEGGKMGDALSGGLIDNLDINSPSKKMFKLGDFAVQGFNNGVANSLKSLYSNGEEASGGFLSGFSSLFSKNAILDSFKSAFSFSDADKNSIFKSAIDGISTRLDTSRMKDVLTPRITPIFSLDGLKDFTSFGNLNWNLAAPIATVGEQVKSGNDRVIASNNNVIQSIKDLREDVRGFFSGESKEVSIYIDGNKVASTLAKPIDRALAFRFRRS